MFFSPSAFSFFVLFFFFFLLFGLWLVRCHWARSYGIMVRFMRGILFGFVVYSLNFSFNQMVEWKHASDKIRFVVILSVDDEIKEKD